jgi:site-specific recombinase XerD
MLLQNYYRPDAAIFHPHETGDLYLVQRALGHRHITTTEIYARVGDDDLRQAITAA